MEPTGATERIPIVDLLRGFALLGIAVVNIAPGSTPVYALLVDLQLWTGPADRLATALIRFLAEGKFYPLFSFLFGLGFAIQQERAEAPGVRFGRLYARRLGALLLIGLVHAFGIWYGDILVLYALLGFVLLLFFRRRAPRTLLIWAGISLLMPILLTAALLGLGGPPDEAAAEEYAAPLRELAEESIRAYSRGTFAEIMAQRARDVIFIYVSFPFFAPNVLAMFLLGLYAARRGILRDVPTHLGLIRAVWRWGLALGLLGGAVYTVTSELSQRAVPSALALAGSVAFGIGGPALGLAYAAGLVLLVQRHPAWGERLAPLAAAGRMALTNYLLQSVVATTVLYSYGPGLYGTIGPALGLGLAAAIYVAELALSVWWLNHFRFGPAEWLWRSLTYGHPQPIRRPARAEPPATA